MSRRQPYRVDNRKSDWYYTAAGTHCSECNGTGSRVDAAGRHVDACGSCRGWGKVKP